MTTAATTTENQRALSIACGAGVKPSTGEWTAHPAYLDYIPNYWTIESADYTDSGFSITGYVHADDARILAAGKALLGALKEIEALTDSLDRSATRAAIERVAAAAIAKAQGR